MIALNNLLIKRKVYTLDILRNGTSNSFRVIYKGRCESDVSFKSEKEELVVRYPHEFMGGKSLACFLAEKKDADLVARVFMCDFFVDDNIITTYELVAEVYSKNSDEYRSILSELKNKGVEK